MNIIFMGTPDFAVPSLKNLINSNHQVSAIVTQPDRPKGRGKKVGFSPIKEIALDYNIEVLQPEKVKDPTFIEKIWSLQPDIIIVIAYGQILPKEILSIPEKGCVNVHASLLPAYRGAAPIHWAIIKGEQKSGVTTMYMNEGLDTGDMILKQEVEITKDMTAGKLHDILADLGAEILLETLSLIEQNKAPRAVQNHEKYSYAPMLDKKLGEIDWEQSGVDIVNLIRGTHPWPGAYTILNSQKMKIVRASIYKGSYDKNKSGTILDYISNKGWVVSTGAGLIIIEEIQMPNNKKMEVDSYIRGHNVHIGTILGKNGSD